MQRTVCIILFLFQFQCTEAQFLDSIWVAFKGKRSLLARYESRNSFADNARIEISSVKGGVTFGKRVSLGAGWCWLTTPVYEDYYINDPENGFQGNIRSKLKLQYFCFYGDYVFYKSRRWMYSVPMQFGVGETSMQYIYSGIKNSYGKSLLVLYEPGINVKFKMLSWLGLGVNVGYRMVLKNNKYVNRKLNSPVYSFGVLIWWDELARSLFPKNEKVKSILGESEWQKK
jgi:hypothetical protein